MGKWPIVELFFEYQATNIEGDRDSMNALRQITKNKLCYDVMEHSIAQFLNIEQSIVTQEVVKFLQEANKVHLLAEVRKFLAKYGHDSS